MTRSARPDNWQDLIAGYALGDLSPEEVEAVQQLLSEHPDLTVEVDHFQEVLALMPYALPEHEPPLHLRASILAAAEAEQADASLQQAAVPRRRYSIGWLGLAGTIAALALVTLAVDNYRLRQEVVATRPAVQRLEAAQRELEVTRPIVAALQQPNAQLYALQGTAEAATASGSIVIAPSQKQVFVVAQNLPQLPQGQAYRLWAMPANSKQPAYCGQFNASSSGTVSMRWSAPQTTCSNEPAQLLITAESATAPPVPQGELVMKSRV